MEIEHSSEDNIAAASKAEESSSADSVAAGETTNLKKLTSGAKRVLIVDDEELLRDVLKETFEDAGYVVEEAGNGRVAFKMIQEHGYDCVVSDIRMPGGDGFELAQNIFQMSGVRPKIFLVTGFSEVTLEKAHQFGVVDILEKPFDIRTLLQAVDVAINGAKVPNKASA